jgi:hypothetical protein
MQSNSMTEQRGWTAKDHQIRSKRILEYLAQSRKYWTERRRKLRESKRKLREAKQ